MKRFIAIFMTLCLVLGLSSISVWADEATWQKETPLITARHGATSCTVGNKIYTMGGLASGTLNSLEIYDATTGKWTAGKSMPTARYYLNSAAVGDKVYVFGGNNSGALNTVEIYDTKTDTWGTGKSMPTARYGLATCTIGNKIYVIGGYNAKNLSTVEIYDTVNDTWITGKSMTTARSHLTASVVGDKIYAIGGEGSGNLSTVEIYDTENDTWDTGKSMPQARTHLNSSAVVGDKIYIVGGHSSGYLKTVVIYDTLTNSWTNGPSMSASRCVLNVIKTNGKIYAIGGSSSGATSLVESLQVETPQTYTPKLSVLLNEGETVQLSTSYNLSNNANYTWSSNNESVATVDSNGKVTAVAEGIADIYAENADGTFKEFISVKVVAMADELRLAVHLGIGEKAKLYLTDDASTVTWSSMDESTATVSADGQITGVKKGLAIVQATLDGQTYQIYVRVNG